MIPSGLNPIGRGAPRHVTSLLSRRELLFIDTQLVCCPLSWRPAFVVRRDRARALRYPRPLSNSRLPLSPSSHPKSCAHRLAHLSSFNIAPLVRLL